MVKCGNSRKSTHLPLWQTCKVLLLWALFWETKVYTVFLRSDAKATIYLLFVLCGYYLRVATIRGRCLFLWKAHRHQQRLDKVGTSKTVTVARRCQLHAHPLGPAVSRGNNSYNTNSFSASMVTIIRNHSHVCVRAAFTSRSY